MAAFLALTSLAPTVGTPASAAPAAPAFGPTIEGYAAYVGQSRCRPRPKPGVVAFEQLLLATYPQVTYTNISRACHVGGRSEHKEGRALDWAADVSVPEQKAAAEEVFAWLFATDQHGNTHAMARRLGIMYVIWNRQMWSSWSQTWEVYCVQKLKKCKDPETKTVLHPHTDHVHFSFSRPGARMRTSYWNPALSSVTA